MIEVVFLDGSTLIRIGAHSFHNCKNLQRINKLPEGLKLIELSAFEGCISLVEVTVPSTVILVGVRCFAHCDSLRRVDFVEPSTTTAALAVVELRAYVFYDCPELLFVRLPQNLLYLPRYCFNRCYLLPDILIPGAVREIRHQSFADCRSLTSIDLSENIDLIEREAFINCSSLLRVTIRSVELQVELDAFRNCPALSSITVFPSVWSELFHLRNNVTLPENDGTTPPTTAQQERHTTFVYTFLRDYYYQIDRLIEWKKAAEDG